MEEKRCWHYLTKMPNLLPQLLTSNASILNSVYAHSATTASNPRMAEPSRRGRRGPRGRAHSWPGRR
nr:unnamed protein product [Callosobruchus analis]